jgi:competence protein ComEC
MATGLVLTAAPVAATPAVASRAVFAENLWRAPLVPVALAATAGIVLDRHAVIPLPVSLLSIVACLAAWAVTRNGPQPGLALVYLWGAVAALGAAYHHGYREVYAPDDIGNYASPEPRPARLRGVLAEEPTTAALPPGDPLRSIPRQDQTLAVLRVTQLKRRDDWIPVSGKARLSVAGRLPDEWHVGDEVEVVGRLVAPVGPANPGEFDYASYLQDQRIRALVTVQKTPDGVRRVAEQWPWGVAGWLAVVRGEGRGVLERHEQTREVKGLVVALLLGETAMLPGPEWEKYICTGVIHVLAVSGQHLAVLAAFLVPVLRGLGVRQRRAAFLIAVFLLAYALLTGGRPPVMRSAVMVCAFCGSLWLRRPFMLANSFALAWLAVAALSPTDLFSSGCQLSFLSVAVLYFGTSRWFPFEQGDPLERLEDENRPRWVKCLRWFGRQVVVSYATGLVIWLAIAPLVAYHYHTVPLVGIIIGPPVVLLASVALLAGFFLLLTAACPPVCLVFAWVTGQALTACDWVVTVCRDWPGSYRFVQDIPVWWLGIFYLTFLAFLTQAFLQIRWRWVALAGLAWLCVGLLGGAVRPAGDELRCTFLAVGHGGCTVLETPDGRTLLYDAGALNGPDVTRRQIAPFLWSRGIRRIDEVFLSHADLDHFNGLLALLDRFAVGQVTCTPTFHEKATPGVKFTVETLQCRGIPVRIARAGDRFAAGAVSLEVIHPPAVGPAGNENARSLVLLVRHAGHGILLTGDLEGPGMDRVLGLPPIPVDVLMAPHHGSRRENIPKLAVRCRPKVVVACQGPPRGPIRQPDPYRAINAQFLGTWPHGAVTVRCRPDRLVVETFRSGMRLVLRPRDAR